MQSTLSGARPSLWIKLTAALLFIGVGAVVMVVFSPLRPIFDKTGQYTLDYVGRILLILLLFLAMVLIRKTGRLTALLPVLGGLLIMAVAVSLDWIFGVYLIKYLRVDGSTPAGYAMQKLNELFVVGVTVILLNRCMGGTLGDLYIQKGNLKLGLIIGFVTFVIASATALPIAKFMFKLNTQAHPSFWQFLPWLVLFVFANAAMEELLFRGLFLKRLQPMFGMFLSNFFIALVFTGLHRAADYTSQMSFFLVVLVLFALAWGYCTQKTNALWAAILFHAGMDISIMLGIFSNLKIPG